MYERATRPPNHIPLVVVRRFSMSIDSREARLERRIADLYASDEQFAAAFLKQSN